MRRRRRLAALVRHTAPESAATATPAAEPAELEPEEPWAPPPLPPAQPMLSRILGPEDLTPTAYDKALSPEDILSFVRPAFSPAATHSKALMLRCPQKENGLLVKKGLLDPEKVERARSIVWDAIEGKMPRVPDCPERHQHSASPGVSRHDPESWLTASVNHDGNQ